MKRNLAELENKVFDVLIIGGGIYGATLAWEAVLRGLSVALVEKKDFCHATSAQSARIVHAGFRYLQNLDLKRLRESTRERNILMRIAPHLVAPVPFMLPTYTRGIENRNLMCLALRVYEAFTFDKNKGIRDPKKKAPAGYVVSREECLRLASGLSDKALTGAAVWFDGLFCNTERLLLAFVRSAAERGACVANYLEVVGLLQERSRVFGVKAEDKIGGGSLEVRGKIIINAAGPWVNQILGFVNGNQVKRPAVFSKVISLVTHALTRDGHGLGIMAPHFEGENCVEAGCCRRLHITPWRGHSIVSSFCFPANGTPEVHHVEEEDINKLLRVFNAAYPNMPLKREDILFTHMGLLPRYDDDGPEANPFELASHYRIIDHKKQDGLEGLISLVSIKYTTARDIAEKAMNLALRKLNRAQAPSKSSNISLWGGKVGNIDNFLKAVCRETGDRLEDEVLLQLVRNYGTGCRTVFNYFKENPDLERRVSNYAVVIQAEIVHAVREEMAQRLQDVVLRRTELGTLGHPGEEALKTCAHLMAQELGWTENKVQHEIEDTEEVYAHYGWKRQKTENSL